jgi:predicted ATPase
MTTLETTKETWFEAEVHRMAGKITLKMPERNAARAQAYFERALSVARAQQAKSWELRAAMSMAQLWRVSIAIDGDLRPDPVNHGQTRKSPDRLIGS